MSTEVDSAKVIHDRPASSRRLKNRLAGAVCGPIASVLPRLVPDSFGILMYHRVIDPPAGVDAPTWNVSPDQLHNQLEGLLARGYEAWPLSAVLQRHNEGLAIPRNAFVVTFDDGYENNLTRAVPVLRTLGVPATIFLATAYLDSDRPFPSDDWAVAGRAGVSTEAWRPLTTVQCRELAADKLIELGAHTHRHLDYRGKPDLLEDDLRECVRVLRQQFGIEQPTFAFPYGTRHLGFSGPPLMDAARRAGVCCALTTESTLVRRTDNPFDWGRFTAGDSDTAATLAAKLAGWYGLARGLSRRLRGLPR